MNTDTMLARLNELDAQLCSAVGISRSGNATTVDEAIAMSAATTDRLLTGERGIRDDTAPPVGHGPSDRVPAGAGRSAGGNEPVAAAMWCAH